MNSNIYIDKTKYLGDDCWRIFILRNFSNIFQMFKSILLILFSSLTSIKYWL